MPFIKQCLYCDKTIETKTRRQSFCNQKCANSFNNSRHSKKEPTTKQCLYCGEKLRIPKSKFCSNSCQMAHTKKENTKNWLETGTCRAVGTRKTHYIRVYLAKEQKNMCAICKNPNIWQRKEINFILDHIDGHYYNNSRDNLRLICPNCDSQLSTFKNRNRGNGRKSRYKKK